MTKTRQIAVGLLAAAFSATALAVAPAFAQGQSATIIDSHRDWNVYRSDAYGGICFAASQPKDSTYSQPISSRGAAFFFVSVIPRQNIQAEASSLIGYPFQDASTVTIDVDGQKFTMFTDGDGAWIDSPSDQPALIEAMRAGRTMIVQGTSRRGTVTTDTYSLSGVTAAIQAAATACSS